MRSVWISIAALLFCVTQAYALGGTQFDLSAGVLIQCPKDESTAIVAQGISGGVRYQPIVAQGNYLRPSRISFALRYYQQGYTTVGGAFKLGSYEGIDFNIGVSGVLSGTYDSLQLGGLAEFLAQFQVSDSETGVLNVGIGWIPDDTRPWLVSLGLGVRTQ